MENEIWKPVFCATLYEVSSMGRLRSLDKYILRKDGVKSFMKGKILKVREWDGYKLLNLKLNDGKKITMRVHQIVYHSFNDTFPTRGKVVDHIDGDRSNNKLNNLQFISYTENTVRGKIHTAKKSELPLYIIKQRKVYRIIKSVGGKSKHFGKKKVLFQNSTLVLKWDSKLKKEFLEKFVIYLKRRYYEKRYIK